MRLFWNDGLNLFLFRLVFCLLDLIALKFFWTIVKSAKHNWPGLKKIKPEVLTDQKTLIWSVVQSTYLLYRFIYRSINYFKKFRVFASQEKINFVNLLEFGSSLLWGQTTKQKFRLLLWITILK
jgi:hypothetical protein